MEITISQWRPKEGLFHKFTEQKKKTRIVVPVAYKDKISTKQYSEFKKKLQPVPCSWGPFANIN